MRDHHDSIRIRKKTVKIQCRCKQEEIGERYWNDRREEKKIAYYMLRCQHSNICVSVSQKITERDVMKLERFKVSYLEIGMEKIRWICGV